MSKFASVFRSVRIIAVLSMVTAPELALATEPAPDAGPAPAAGPSPASKLACHDKAVTGSGPGFSASQDLSAEAAQKDWLTKALAIYADATWSTAKDARMECVRQGLYSKCFASGAPCHPPLDAPAASK